MIDLIYIILALLAGIIAGVVTGLIPGVHVNLIAVLLFSIPLAFISQLSPIILVVFIVAMMLTHTFLDFIPSIFLGAPDTDTELSILPGHELLSKGRGYEAVIYTAYGSALGILIILLLTPIFIFLLPKIFVYLKSVIFLILILASIYLITIEKKSRLYALIVFILAGFLGISSSSLAIENSLLPLLTGLFGSSSLITSIIKKEKLPKQRITRFWNIKVEIKELIKTGFASMASAPLCTFLPSLGSGQAAVIGSDLIGETNRKQFLVLLGSINTIVAGLALITFYAIAETRTGAVMAIEQIIGSITTLHLYMLMTIILISGIAG
ncbi:MAG: tripartite tricarboxylate transporter permease, partial [Candidatus Thorarchaeota archaeon]